MESGVAEISLTNRSALSGAMLGLGDGQVGSVTMDSDSVWNLRGSSVIGTLESAGEVIFSAPVDTQFVSLPCAASIPDATVPSAIRRQ